MLGKIEIYTLQTLACYLIQNILYLPNWQALPSQPDGQIHLKLSTKSTQVPPF
jgi:hypothetical protein